MDCDCLQTPFGMSRRHFMRHLAGASALVAPAFALTRTLRANAKSLSKNHKSAILLWLGGGPPSIDMWDMKPGAPTAGQFKPISTTGDFQICELMPSLAKQGKHLAIVRSMSTREADHDRGRYYMHTGYVPNPNVEHPSYGSVVAHEMESKVPRAGDSAVRVDRRGERRARVFGDGVRAVSGRCQRADSRRGYERAGGSG